MGLDKDIAKELTIHMKLLGLGLGAILRALGFHKKARMSLFERERKSYEADARKEFLKLKERGLSIPVFTL